MSYIAKTMARDVPLPKKATQESFRRRQQIGAALRAMREKKKLTIEASCIAAGVSFHTWKRWEEGETAIPVERLADISRALSADIIPSIRPYLHAA